MRLDLLVTESETVKAFGSSTFGIPNRRVIKTVLLKRASGYHCGYTAIQICIELGLLTEKAHTLTKKGRLYLWEAFSGELDI